MNTITWNTEVNAPCAGEILGPKTRERNKRGQFTWGRQSILVQNDWDYPSVAQSFGWGMREVQVQNTEYYGLTPCEHDGTDGTVICRACGLTATDFISAAYRWLAANNGATAEDPGYFI